MRGRGKGLQVVAFVAVLWSGRAPGAEPVRRDHAIVLLAQPVALPVQRIVEDYAKMSSPRRRPEIVPGTARDGAKLRLEGGTVSIDLVRNPLSARELGAAARVSWKWPHAIDAVAGHQAYVDVTLNSRNTDAIEHNLILTRLVGAVLSAMGGQGVYWGNAVVLIEPNAYRLITAEATGERPPVKIWVNFLPAALPDGTPVVHTIGLSSLSMPEVVLIEGRTGAEIASLNMLYGVSEYVVRNRLQLRTGDSLNISPTESLLAKEIPAPWDGSETAILLRSRPSDLPQH